MADPFKAGGRPIGEAAGMADIDAAAQFVHGHGRLLERRRFDHHFADGDAAAVLRAVAAYQNPDGGIGCMDPDLRTPASLPSSVLYAFDVLHEIGEAPAPITGPALDWIATIANADGGIPFVLPSAKAFPHAPWWTPHDDPPSSLLMTAGVAGAALRLRLTHPWLDRAAEYIWRALSDLKTGDAYTFRYAVHFLDARPDRERAEAELQKLKGRMPSDGILKVEKGVE